MTPCGSGEADLCHQNKMLSENENFDECHSQFDVYSKCFSRKFTRRALRYLYTHHRLAAVDVREVFSYQYLKASSAQKRAMKERWDTVEKMVDYVRENMTNKCTTFHDKRNNKYTVQLISVEFETGQQASNSPEVITPVKRLNRGDYASTEALDISSARDEMNTPRNQPYDDIGDIFGLNKLIVASCPERGLEKPARADLNYEPQKNTSVTDSAHFKSNLRKNWPLARPRVCVPYATTYRNASRRLQMKQLLERITFDDHESSSRQVPLNKATSSSNCKSSLEELKLELETLREQENRRPNWLCQDITVRVVSTRLGKKLFLQTADVLEVKQDYTALIKFHHDGTVLYADQIHLQTAILCDPQQKELRVLIVNGAYRGCTGTVENRPSDTSCLAKNGNVRESLTIKIDKGVFNGRILRYVQADDVASLTRSHELIRLST